MFYPVLDNISVSFEKGKIHSIIGRSGAGKSTFMRCLNHLEEPDQGSILMNGIDYSKCSGKQKKELLRSTGTVFQKVNLLSRRTVYENIRLPLEWMGEAYSLQGQNRIKNLISRMGLEGLENRFPAQLSGGQSQRVAIARALVTEPDLLLCDEFTSALDPETSLEILSLLRDINRELGVTIILITHDMSVVREVSDFIYVMDKGCIVESGELEQVLLHPRHSTTQSLLRGLFIKELPYHLQNQLQKIPQEGQRQEAVIQLVFSGKVAKKPVITQLIREKGISVNILAGSLDHLRESVFGALMITIPNQNNQVQLSLEHFQENHISAEVLGYIPHESTEEEV